MSERNPDFDAIDAVEGNTMVVFDSLATANAYCLHQIDSKKVHGVICRAIDERDGTGLVVQWRDPIPFDRPIFEQRQREALWLLEEVLAGRVPRPEPGKTLDISAIVEARRTAGDA